MEQGAGGVAGGSDVGSGAEAGDELPDQGAQRRSEWQAEWLSGRVAERRVHAEVDPQVGHASFAFAVEYGAVRNEEEAVGVERPETVPVPHFPAGAGVVIESPERAEHAGKMPLQAAGQPADFMQHEESAGFSREFGQGDSVRGARVAVATAGGGRLVRGGHVLTEKRKQTLKRRFMSGLDTNESIYDIDQRAVKVTIWGENECFRNLSNAVARAVAWGPPFFPRWFGVSAGDGWGGRGDGGRGHGVRLGGGGAGGF